jgi:SagB-type dehydrogenase family enzyme
MDQPLNEFLGLDAQREVVFSMVSLGHVKREAAAQANEVVALQLPMIQQNQTEIDYPLMRDIHAASSLVGADEVVKWRGRTPALKPSPPAAKLIPLPRVADRELANDSIEDVILRRGSTRRFAQVPITITEFSALLDRATRGVPADFLDPTGSRLNDLYLIVNDVEDVPSGAYFYHRDRHALEQLRAGNFRKMAGYLGLEQELPATASVCVFFLADLNAILERFGNRGYRATQLETGIIGGKLYLAAYAQRLGATGLTFYDDDVVRFFSPHADGKSAIFLVAVGKSQSTLKAGLVK